MTKTQFKRYIRCLLKHYKQYLYDEALRLFNSGGIDPTEYEDNYALPKVILCVAIEHLADNMMPYTPDLKDAVKNLRHF